MHDGPHAPFTAFVASVRPVGRPAVETGLRSPRRGIADAEHGADARDEVPDAPFARCDRAPERELVPLDEDGKEGPARVASATPCDFEDDGPIVEPDARLASGDVGGDEDGQE